MKQRAKLLFLSLILFSQLAFPQFVLASHCPLAATENPTTAAKVTGVVAALAGIAALLVIIYGGFKYMTAQGDQKALASARSTITLAVAGLIMVLIAYFIIAAISSFTGLSNLRKLTIPKP